MLGCSRGGGTNVLKLVVFGSRRFVAVSLIFAFFLVVFDFRELVLNGFFVKLLRLLLFLWLGSATEQHLNSQIIFNRNNMLFCLLLLLLFFLQLTFLFLLLLLHFLQLLLQELLILRLEAATQLGVDVGSELFDEDPL